MGTSVPPPVTLLGLSNASSGVKRPRDDPLSVPSGRGSLSPNEPRSKAPRPYPPFALRGIEAGRIPVEDSPDFVPCLVLGRSFPCWLFHLTSLRLKLNRIILQSPIHLDLVVQAFPLPARVDVCQQWGDTLSPSLSFPEGTICLLEGRVTGTLLSLLAGVGIHEIFSTARTRSRSFAGWETVPSRILHSSVGGVTLHDSLIIRHSRGSLSGLPLPVPQAMFRDASTVLSQAVFARHFRAIPTPPFLNPPRCVNLGSDVQPFYHGYGWLPARLDSSVRVLLPTLNSPQHGGRWGLRPITRSEILTSLDVPGPFVQLLTQRPLSGDFYHGLLPGKSLIFGL